MTDTENSHRYRYMTNRDLMIAVAEAAQIDDYDPDRAGENTKYSRFTKAERRQIYKALTGDQGEEYERKQLPEIILNEIGEELNSNFADEFSKEDLKNVHKALVNN